MVEFVVVDEQLVLAGNLVLGNLLRGGDVGTRHLLASVLKRCCHEPAVLVLEHLVDAHLMALAGVLEAGVVYQIGAAVLSSDDGVVALRALAIVALGLVAPVGVGAEDVLATVAVVGVGSEVQLVAVENGTGVLGVHVGPVRILRAEHAHLVAAVVVVAGHAACCQATVAHEEVVVAADILDVAGFARHIVAASNLLAEVGVDGDVIARTLQFVLHVVVAQTGLLVELEHVDNAAPRAVRHPEFALFVVEHAGVDVVGIAVAPFLACIVSGRQRSLLAEYNLQIGVLIGVVLEESADDHRSLIAVWAFYIVGGQQNDAGVPVVAIDTEIHAPFIHRLVVDDIGRPHHAVHAVSVVLASATALRPFEGVEVEVVLHAALLHLRHLRGGEGCCIRAVVADTIRPGHADLRPVHHVGGLGVVAVRAEDVVGF